MGAKHGFTLIELMIVVAIIGILAAIAIPKFADMIRKASEGKGKANLGALRSTLSIYYGDMEGLYPANLAALTIGGKYIEEIMTAKAPNYHVDSAAAEEDAAPSDASGWHYNNVVTNANFGLLLVNCTHTDSKGTIWTAF